MLTLTEPGLRVSVTWGVGQGGFYKLFIRLNFSNKLNIIVIFYRKVSLGLKCFSELQGRFPTQETVYLQSFPRTCIVSPFSSCFTKILFLVLV